MDKKSTGLVMVMLAVNIGLSGALLLQGSGTSESTKLETQAAETAAGPAVAKVNGLTIAESDLVPYLSEIASRNNIEMWQQVSDVPGNVLSVAINSAALDKLILQKADEAELASVPAVTSAIDQSRARILKNAWLKQVTPSLVSDEEIKSQYASLAASLEGKSEYRVRHILVATENEAALIRKAMLEQAKSFEELANLFSLDKGSAAAGGDLGYVLEGELNSEFETQVANLPLGEVSAPFPTELGWHVAVVEDRRESRPMPYEQAYTVIRSKLEKQAVQKHLQAMVAGAKVEQLAYLDTQATAPKADNQ